MLGWSVLFQLLSAILFFVYLRYTDSPVPPLVGLVFILPLFAYFIFVLEFISRWTRITVRGTTKLKQITKKQKSYIREFEERESYFIEDSPKTDSTENSDSPESEDEETGIAVGSHLGRMGERRAEIHFDPRKPLNEIQSLRDYSSSNLVDRGRTMALIFSKVSQKQSKQIEDLLKAKGRLKSLAMPNVFKEIDALELPYDLYLKESLLFDEIELLCGKSYKYFIYVTPIGRDIVEDLDGDLRLRKSEIKKRIAPLALDIGQRT